MSSSKLFKVKFHLHFFIGSTSDEKDLKNSRKSFRKQFWKINHDKENES